MESSNNNEAPLTFRKPELKDGHAIYQLIKACPPLDVNSSYLYFLQASHFADTCIVAEKDQEIVGFISAYFRPDEPRSLFIWQVAVAESARGIGLAKRMLNALLKNQENSYFTEITCTISPSNKPSQGLFKSFSKAFDLQLSTEPFITAEDFGDEGHEAEDLYVLTAPTKQNLINYLF